MTLDALLAEVERLESVLPDVMPDDGVAVSVALASKAPLLARMLREAVEALYAGANLVNGPAECHAALSRLDAMAGEVDA